MWRESHRDLYRRLWGLSVMSLTINCESVIRKSALRKLEMHHVHHTNRRWPDSLDLCPLGPYPKKNLFTLKYSGRTPKSLPLGFWFWSSSSVNMLGTTAHWAEQCLSPTQVPLDPKLALSYWLFKNLFLMGSFKTHWQDQAIHNTDRLWLFSYKISNYNSIHLFPHNMTTPERLW